jgi:simple sugar transport system permease protein
MTQTDELPRWIDLGVLPALNLAFALLVSGAVVLGVGQDPAQVLSLLIKGAFGTRIGVSYTLYYATTFVFTGLAVAVAFHGGLFNIGGEGQAMLGGLGTALMALWLSHTLPGWLLLPLMLVAGALFGMAWAWVPAWLQAYRGSHVVITTIMFNFLASTLLVWLLVDHLKPAGSMAEGCAFGAAAQLPGMHRAPWLRWSGPPRR